MFTVDEIVDWLNCSRNKAIDTMEELVTAKLIRKEQEKRGVANKYYIEESSLYSALNQYAIATTTSVASEPKVVQNVYFSYLEKNYPNHNPILSKKTKRRLGKRKTTQNVRGDYECRNITSFA